MRAGDRIAGIGRFDVIVIGAGPAGAMTAHRLADRGASVLLLDRASFPREKPCGGGLTIRAVRLLPFSLAPVVEDVVDRLELRLRYGPRFERVRAKPLALMTQRRRLDAFLAERAALAGADFRDGVRVTAVTADERGVVVGIDGQRLRAEAVIGADGANGVTARSLDLCACPAHGVALEGSLPYETIDPDRYRGRILFELGVVRGGYGWIFPKGDHVNVGVGGWQRAGPGLRRQLARLCREHGLPHERLEGVLGYRLPVGRRDAVLARGRGLVVGDAAGLVDPLTGDGIYEAFVSAALAADVTAELLAGRARDLEPYNALVRRALGRQLSSAWAAKVALECFPRLMFNVARSELVQRPLERLARGELRAADTRRRSRLPLEVLGIVARALGDAGHALATAGPRPARVRAVS
jgi:geranylgeranyl reductase family protein